MLEVIRFILLALAVLEVIFLFLSLTLFPENKIIKFFRKKPILQAIFWIILVCGILFSHAK